LVIWKLRIALKSTKLLNILYILANICYLLSKIQKESTNRRNRNKIKRLILEKQEEYGYEVLDMEVMPDNVYLLLDVIQ